MFSLLKRMDFFLDLFVNLKLDCLAFIPVVSYNDAFNKKLAITDNKGKSGIYRWTHLDSKKSYIGSSVNLGLRLRNYFCNLSFISHPTRNMMVINKALLKHGYYKFKFEIIEYCGPKELAIREQYYMDQLFPEYNVLKTDHH